MAAAESFVRHYNKSLFKAVNKKDETPLRGKNIFINEFLIYVPEILDELQQYIDSSQLHNFYIKLNNLKFLVEYADDLNRYWFVLRAYSGGLRKLMEEKTVRHSLDVYLYYYLKYGKRRILKDENWFEHKRWEFLDQLTKVDDENELAAFINRMMESLDQYFQVYKNELLRFHSDVKKIIEAD
ncbi:hypothetical protein [Gaoshiqia sp. Z1-71]|uniref:hypothetical protein n=1 Tax=Gaoshiqia hydrogeniformans TaxID=3290090 RepID=UPI003BF781DD